MGISETLKFGGQFARSLLMRTAQEFAAHIGDSSQMFVLLTVRPLFRGSETVVSLQLSTNVGQAEADDDPAEQPWEVPYSAFEAGTSDDADAVQGLPELKVPEQLAAGLRYRLALKQVPAGKPLWLKLARPYGVLGTVPWESELNAALGCPVLRLPDYPERPVERPDILESAVIVDVDANADAADLARRVRTLVDATLAGSSRTVTRVHVFAASRWYAGLKSLERGRRIVVHDPEQAETSDEAMKNDQNSPPLRSATWSNWVITKLAGASLDVVHMVTRAQWVNGEACLLVSASPCARDKQLALTAVELDEFALLVNRIGAWAVTFTPPSPYYAPAVAFVADALAHLRPGAVLFNRGDDAADLATLAAVGTLLFSARPSTAPLVGHGFLYCHPAFVKGEQQQSAGTVATLLADNARLLAQRAPLGQRFTAAISHYLPWDQDVKLNVPPAWIGAVQRYLESTQLDEARRSSPDVFLSNLRPGSAKAIEAINTVSQKATAGLTAVQSVLQNYKTPDKGG